MTHSVDNYGVLELRNHIREIPDTYLGSMVKLERQERVLLINEQTKGWSFGKRKVDIPPAAIRCMMEILTNASDNVRTSINQSISPGAIEVSIIDDWIEITNGGLMIPIEKKDLNGEMIYVPEMTFGNLLTSSNYKGPRIGGGRNGYGAKLTNIFANTFSISICCPTSGKKYEQTWSNAMMDKTKPKITKYSNRSKPRMTVRYKMDFERFNMVGLSDNDIALMGRYCADVAYTCGVKIRFNGVTISFKDCEAFAKALFPNDKMLAFKYEGQVKRQLPKDISESGISKKDYNSLTAEVCIIDSRSSKCYAYVNGMENPDGGVHLNAALDAFCKVVCPIINSNHVAKKYSTKISKRDVRGKVSIIVSVSVIDPTFEGQAKLKLNTPNMSFVMPKDLVSSIDSWKFMTIMLRTLGIKGENLSKKTDGKKTKYVNISSAEDANEAGGRNSRQCTLYVLEGNSAAGYIVHGLDKGDRDLTGIYPMRGKILNATKASDACFAGNRVIADIKAMLGLKEDTDYSIESNFSSLRYGKLVVAGDADVDGTHIVALVANLFNEKYKSLIKRGFVTILRTPIIKAFKGKKVIKFYSEESYRKWEKTKAARGFRHEYYKGLGSYEPSDSKEDFKDPKIPELVHDEHADENFRLAFCPKQSRERKKWIDTNIGQTIPIDSKQILMSDLINSELISYSAYSIFRSIAKLSDGLKDVQRKIIYGSIKYWKTYNKKSTRPESGVEVCRVAAAIAGLTAYHHGPTSMENAIVEMTNDYAGSNNMPYFVQKGLFGTRNGTTRGCGKDASKTRYCRVKPQPWWPYMYMQEDVPLLEREMDDGKDVGPKFLLPILPMVLINGSRGVATGWSTYIPCHHPIEVADWILDKLEGIETKSVYPWYRDFNGSVELVRRSNLKVKDKQQHDEVSVDQSTNTEGVVATPDGDDYEPLSLKDLDPSARLAMRVSGTYELWGNDRANCIDDVIVNEIPIGVAIHNYASWLTYLCTQKKSITSFKNMSEANVPCFKIKGMKNPTMKKLKLRKSFGLGIMNCLGEDGKPYNFKSSHSILEAFYEFRLPFYEKRKQYILDSKRERLRFLDNRSKFLKAIAVDKSIEVMNIPKSSVHKAMEKQGITDVANVYGSVSIANCSKEELERNMRAIEEVKGEIEIIEATSAKEMWVDDIDRFLKIYKSIYGDD